MVRFSVLTSSFSSMAGDGRNHDCFEAAASNYFTCARPVLQCQGFLAAKRW